APDLRPALAVRDIKALFWWLNRRGWSQTQIGAMTGQSQPEVSAIMYGRQVQAYAVAVRIADGLGIPRGYFGLSHCVRCAGNGVTPASMARAKETIRCNAGSSSARPPSWRRAARSPAWTGCC